MGFFDSIINAINESVDTGKSVYNTQNKWKNEEKEYTNNTTTNTIDINQLIELIDLKVSEKKCDIMINYGNTNDIKDYKKERAEIRKQIQKIKSSSKNSHNKNDDDYTEFVDRYNNKRNKRVAFCVSYLNHPKSTTQGRIDAMMIILLSPHYKGISHLKLDCPFLKERFSIYERRLKNKEDLSVLDYCFYGNLFTEAEIMPEIFFSKSAYMDKLSAFMACRNTMSYYDENYKTHLCQPSFFKLSMKYTNQVAIEEEKIITSIISNLGEKEI